MKLDDVFNSIAQDNSRIKQVSGDYIPLPSGVGEARKVLYVNCVYRLFSNDPTESLIQYQKDAASALAIIHQQLGTEDFISVCLSFYEPANESENIRAYRTTVLKEDLNNLSQDTKPMTVNEICYPKRKGG